MEVISGGFRAVSRCECAFPGSFRRDCCENCKLVSGRRGFLGRVVPLRFGFEVSAPQREIPTGCFCIERRGRRWPPLKMVDVNGEVGEGCCGGRNPVVGIRRDHIAGSNPEECEDGNNRPLVSTVGKSTNIVWQDCSVGKAERQQLLNQKGCVIWITGLSGSGKSTLACSLSRELHARRKLSYILDGDNVRHGLNKDLSFCAEDRAENIRRVGEVAKLFADAGVICIASLISPYRRDRDVCRALLPDANFIEVYLDVPLEVCEARDAKGLYKLARAGKIKGFTGIDDPYEPPLNCEIVIQQKDGACPSPGAMAKQVVAYLEKNGFLCA